MDGVDGEQSHSFGAGFIDVPPLPPLPTVGCAPPLPPLPDTSSNAVDDVLVEEALAVVEEASSESEGAPPQPPPASGPNDRDTAFDKRLEELRAYREAHGHLRISKKERSLSNFCSNARRARNNPGRGRLKLTEDRIASLDALGFTWEPKAGSGGNRRASRKTTDFGLEVDDRKRDGTTSFQERIEKLRAYKEKHGHTEVGKGEKSDDPSLGRFCTQVRYSRNNPEKASVPLSNDRIAALDELGFRWTVQKGKGHGKSFSDHLVDLQAYHRANGHVNVKASENAKLATFCYRVRKARKRPGRGSIKLTEDRIASLDALGFTWETKARKNEGKRRSFDDLAETACEDTETTGVKPAILKRMACGDCDGCKRKACKECDACTGSPKKRCIQRQCTLKVWVDGAEYAAWKASGKTTPKPLPQPSASSGKRARRSFSDHLVDLKAYHQAKGHTNVKVSENANLANFCFRVRRARKNPDRKGAIKLSMEGIHALDALGFQWSKGGFDTRSFAQRIEDLRAYKDAHGHIDFIRKEDPQLLHFCNNVRYAHNHPGKGNVKLTEDRIAALNAVGFRWEFKTKKMKSFSERVDELRDFKAEHSHLRIPGERKSLATFCQRVRRARSDPDRTTMKLTDDRIAALDEIGFCWDAAKVTGHNGKGSGQQVRKSFSERIEDLRAYKEKHGHLNVSKEEDSSLFHFTNNVRYGRSNPGKGMAITEDRVATLDELGFRWRWSNGGVEGRKNDQSFAQRIEDLKAYKSEHGHLDVMQKENAILHHFCYNMRYARANPGKGMTITEDRIAALDAIGFPWSGGSGGRRVRKSFSERVEELATYKEKHGHLKVSKEEDSSLFYFIRNAQNARRNPGKRELSMTDDRIAALDAIGFPWKRSKPTTRRWGGPQKQFDGRVNELKAYKSKHGHLNVGKKDDLSLHRFCRMARYARANPGKGGLAMAEGRIAALDAIGFPWKTAARKGSESATRSDNGNLKRIACGDCEGCKKKACKECDACTGVPKKRCIHRLCTKQLWVDKAEYAAWKASGKSGPRPSPKEREGSDQSNENVDATAEREVEAAVPSEDNEVSFGKSGGQIEVRCNEMFSPLKRRGEENTRNAPATREEIMQLPKDNGEPSEAPGQEMAIDLTEDHDEDSSAVPAFLLGGKETMSFSV